MTLKKPILSSIILKWKHINISCKICLQCVLLVDFPHHHANSGGGLSHVSQFVMLIPEAHLASHCLKALHGRLRFWNPNCHGFINVCSEKLVTVSLVHLINQHLSDVILDQCIQGHIVVDYLGSSACAQLQDNASLRDNNNGICSTRESRVTEATSGQLSYSCYCPLLKSQTEDHISKVLSVKLGN